MEITIRRLDRPAEEYAGIEQLCEITQNEEMIPLTPEAIDAHVIKMGAFEDSTSRLIGYSAVTMHHSPQLVEFGGCVVKPGYRRHGTGERLTQHTVEDALNELGSGNTIIAFANKLSLPLFVKLGGSVVEDTADLPKSCWKLCMNCQCEGKPADFSLQNPKCADTVVDITLIHPGRKK